MYFLEKVLIENFWGDKTVKIDFKKDVNFLIGVNGSGKTTIINLIAATLNTDLYILGKSPFGKIQLTLKGISTKERKVIQIEKKEQKKSPFTENVFRVILGSQSEEFLLTEGEDEQVFMVEADLLLNRFRGADVSSGYKMADKVEGDLYSAIKNLVNVSWLSVNRLAGPIRRHDERSLESIIDQKIQEISNSLLKYFSSLDKQSVLETDKFQEFILLSLLRNESEDSRRINLNPGKVNVENEKESLMQISALFKVDQSTFSQRLDTHYEYYLKTEKKLSSKEQPIEIKDLRVLLDTERIKLVIKKWKQIIDKQKVIYNYRDIFLSIVNNLFQRKQIRINDKNELQVHTQSGKVFSLFSLSSGEKQLIILLGESLLQQASPHIYIADEPELSLHVDWQEKLVTSLRSLNPNAQIIFATHSPDIVSVYSEAVINIEDTISNEL